MPTVHSSVRLRTPAPPGSTTSVPVDVTEALDLARGLPSTLRPGGGGTLELWELLAGYAAYDLAVARAVEPHLDALAILDQAGRADLAGELVWGVFAAEAPGTGLHAREKDGEWSLTGSKPWCSLAARIDAALVTAFYDDGDRGLFAVNLRGDGVRLEDEPWAARGLVEIPSTAVVLDGARATPVGGPGWYLSRPGFWWGGIGVAACWYGGLVQLARTVHARVARTPDAPLLARMLGQVDLAVEHARLALLAALGAVDGSGDGSSDGSSDGSGDSDGGAVDGPTVALRTRGAVAYAAEEVLRLAGHALGPAPLALDDDHAKRVADLTLYLRQHHADRDDAALGEALARQDAPW